MNSRTLSPATPFLVNAIAGFGVLWNLFGVYQFATSLTRTADDMMNAGFSRHQAELYLSLPGWMTLAFGIGVLGGLAGSLALLFARPQARAILGVSLAAYLVLFAGDAAFGLFAAIPAQLAILSFVVAVAVTLLATALLAGRRQA